MKPLNIFCVVLILGFQGIECYPGGAPSSACVYLLPLHGYPNILAQSSPSPYTLHMSAGTYIPGQELEVAIKADTSPFNGWLLQVRRVDTNMTVGRFISAPDGAKLVSCNGQDNALTHSNSYSFPNNTLIAKWLAPDTDVGDIILVGTVLKDYSTFWGPLTSNHVSPTPPQPSTTTTTTTTPEPTTTTPSSTSTQTPPVTTTSPTTTISTTTPTTTNPTTSQSESSSTSSTPSTSVPAQPTISSTVQPSTSPNAQSTTSSTVQSAISSTTQPTIVKIASTQTSTREATTTQPTSTPSTSTQPTTTTSSQPSTSRTTVKIYQTTTATRVWSSTTKEDIPVSVTSNIPGRQTTESDNSGEEVDSDNPGNTASTPESILSVYIIYSLLSLSNTLFI
ncbi:hypothetical protein SNE40_023475 [Patella caerulea]|uniref:Reelin domain-containing protein n=1 Tax=Patella caerulea TaxID=87958 RepID=A0AAN8IYQ8_PATCE